MVHFFRSKYFIFHSDSLEKKRKSGKKRFAGSTDDDTAESSVKKVKTNSQELRATLIRIQNDEFYKLREMLHEYLPLDSLKLILKHNKQSVPKNRTEVCLHVCITSSFKY